MREIKVIKLWMFMAAVTLSASAQTNTGKFTNAVVTASVTTNASAVTQTNEMAFAQRVEEIRNACVNGRRTICGRVIKILPNGIVVDSGYTDLLKPPLNQSWLTSSGALLHRDPKRLEISEPGSPCIGLVFLANFPKRPPVKQYDYVALVGYPVGRYVYHSVPGVEKDLRKFSAGLDTAIKMNLEATEK